MDTKRIEVVAAGVIIALIGAACSLIGYGLFIEFKSIESIFICIGFSIILLMMCIIGIVVAIFGILMILVGIIATDKELNSRHSERLFGFPKYGANTIVADIKAITACISEVETTAKPTAALALQEARGHLLRASMAVERAMAEEK